MWRPRPRGCARMHASQTGKGLSSRFRLVTGAACAALVFLGAGAAVAGKSSCYEQVTVPPVYGYVEKRVLVQPAHSEVVVTPAVYGVKHRRVVVKSAKSFYQKIAPIYQTRSRRVMVQPASVRWEYQWRHGRQVLCKIPHPPVYQTVHEKVLVRPGQKVRVTEPAVYGTVQESVVVRRPSRQKVRHPAIYRTISQRVQIQPARAEWRPIRSRCQS